MDVLLSSRILAVLVAFCLIGCVSTSASAHNLASRRSNLDSESATSGAGAGRRPCTWSTWPKATPSASWPDGPILGNGNIGVSFGGGDGYITAYMTVTGFWAVNSGNYSQTDPHGTPWACPGENCTVPTGQSIGWITIASPQLVAGSINGSNSTWNAVMWLDNATVQIQLSNPDNGAGMRLTAWASATTQLIVFMLENVGSGMSAVDVPAAGGGSGDGTSRASPSLGLSAPTLDLNITTWANNNVLQVPVTNGCFDAGAGVYAPCPDSANSAVPGLFVHKYATVASGNPLMIDGIVAIKPLNATSAITTSAPTAVMDYSVPVSYWATGHVVDTLTTGTSTFFSLPPPSRGTLETVDGSVAATSDAGAAASALTFVATAAASLDPGVYPQPVTAIAMDRLSAITIDDIPSLYSNHTNWWDAYWSASSVSLDPTENDTEAVWYSSLYALGSGARAGQVAMDLWSPWRTTDYPWWRSDFTMDYNFQAQYSGVFGANHADLAQPYFDFIDAQLQNGSPQAESASLGCPGGVHFSTDLGPFGTKFGNFGIPENWGIFSNSAYAAITYVYQWETTPLNFTWVNAYAWPFLSQVAAFWACRLVKTNVSTAVNPDGYQYWDMDDCTGDEGCKVPSDERNNPMWGVVYIRRTLETLVSIAAATKRTVDPAWVDVLDHWPAIPTTWYNASLDGGASTNSASDADGAAAAAPEASASVPVPVLGWYGGGSNFTSFSKQANEMHAIWPGGLISMSEPNATLLLAAQNALRFQNWGQSNSFSWVYSSAARAGLSPDYILSAWHNQLPKALSRPNRLIAFGGLCSDSLGVVQFIHDMLVQGQEGFVRLFPAWPGNLSASFEGLRMKGAVLVSASYVGNASFAGQVAGFTGGVDNVTITTEVAGPVTVLSPWPAAGENGITVCEISGATTGSVRSPVGVSSSSSSSAAPSSSCSAPLPLSWSTVGGFNGGPAFTWTVQAGSTYAVFGPASG